jgi:hypothetical protein
LAKGVTEGWFSHPMVEKKKIDRFWPMGVAEQPNGQNQSNNFLFLFSTMGWPNHPIDHPRPAKVGGLATLLFFFFFFFSYFQF